MTDSCFHCGRDNGWIVILWQNDRFCSQECVDAQDEKDSKAEAWPDAEAKK